MSVGPPGGAPRAREALRRAAFVTVAVCAAALFLVTGCEPAPPGTPREILEKSIKAQDELESVFLEVETEAELTLPGGVRASLVTYEGDYEKPDRWKLTMFASGAKTELIIIGEDAYVRTAGSDSWAKKQADLLDVGSGGPGGVVSEYMDSARNVKLLDSKGDTYHLGFVLDIGRLAPALDVAGVDPGSLEGKEASMEVWVLKDSLLMEKAIMEFAGEFGEPVMGELETRMEAEFSGFNEPVSIEPPM